MATCFNCGSELIWQSDFMQSELDGYDYDEDDDRVVNILYCPNCHADVYVYHASENMLKEYEKDNEDEKKEYDEQ